MVNKVLFNLHFHNACLHHHHHHPVFHSSEYQAYHNRLCNILPIGCSHSGFVANSKPRCEWEFKPLLNCLHPSTLSKRDGKCGSKFFPKSEPRVVIINTSSCSFTNNRKNMAKGFGCSNSGTLLSFRSEVLQNVLTRRTSVCEQKLDNNHFRVYCQVLDNESRDGSRFCIEVSSSGHHFVQKPTPRMTHHFTNRPTLKRPTRIQPLRFSWWDWFSKKVVPPPPPEWPRDEISDEESDSEENGYSSSSGTVINTLTISQQRQLVGGSMDVEDLEEDDEEFKAWKMQREAMEELRAYQKDGRDPDKPGWEDWLDEQAEFEEGVRGWYDPQPEWEKGGIPKPTPTLPERGMRRTVWDFLLRVFNRDSEVEEDLSFEERVFRFTSISTTKFVACLILIPWMFDFLVHDYVLMPFLERYVETTPMVAELLDVRPKQKLELIEKLKIEKVRIQFEADIGKTPPLTLEEVEEHLLEHAYHLRDEMREENRSAFANIFSDFLAASLAFTILLFNPRQVAIMRVTGIRIFTNISDTAKAFVIILLSDIVFGYHSEEGWETAVEMILEHYGLPMNSDAVYLFVFSFPVAIDSIFKLWVFKRLNTVSPGAAVTFRTMKRH